jgi:uncharacterized RDD family membrane protein YckC
MSDQKSIDRPYRETAIVTPEHVQLRFQTAGLGSRAAAQLIDTLLLLLVNLTVFVLIVIVVFGSEEEFFQDENSYALAILLIVLTVLNFAYFLLMEYFRGGQTLGKKWMGLRVIQENGQSLTFLSAVIRNLFRIIDNLPAGYFLGGLVVFFHPRDKRIGDMVAGTIVVLEDEGMRLSRRHKKRKLARWMADAPPFVLTEQQKQAITREDWQLLSAYVDRLMTMAEDRRMILALEITRRLCDRLDWPDRKTAMAFPIGFLLQLHEQLQHEGKIGP